MGEVIPFARKNRDIDNIFLELERLNIPTTDIIGVLLTPKNRQMIKLEDGNLIPEGFPFLGFGCETTKEQGLKYLEKYSGEFKFLQILLKDEAKIFFDNNGFQTTFERLFGK